MLLINMSWQNQSGYKKSLMKGWGAALSYAWIVHLSCPLIGQALVVPLHTADALEDATYVH